VIDSFGDDATRDVFDGVDSKAARSIAKALWGVARRKLDLLNAAHDERDLRVPPNNRFEHLKGGLKGRCSIRVNDQYRIVFVWKSGNASNVRITDYH
jgi:proteic killer suppression protein